VIAASFTDRAALASLYEHLVEGLCRLVSESAIYYRDYLAHTVSVHLPDAQIESAYDWAK